MRHLHNTFKRPGPYLAPRFVRLSPSLTFTYLELKRRAQQLLSLLICSLHTKYKVSAARASFMRRKQVLIFDLPHQVGPRMMSIVHPSVLIDET